MDDKPYAIFLSCGTPYTRSQEGFLSAIEAHLKSHNCEPQTIGRNNFSVRQPVEASRQLIARSDGAVVIAFERTRILEGSDKPDSADEKKIRKESHPTIWNHMEASMAYAQRVPILTLVQPGLKRHGMLSDRLEWKAVEKDLVGELLQTDEFRQVFKEWMSKVREHRVNPAEVDWERINIDEFLKQLKKIKLTHLFGLIAALLGVLATVATLAFKAGQALRLPPAGS